MERLVGHSVEGKKSDLKSQELLIPDKKSLESRTTDSNGKWDKQHFYFHMDGTMDIQSWDYVWKEWGLS